MRPRHRARALAVRVLFQTDPPTADWRGALAYQLAEEGLPAEAAAFAEELVALVETNGVEIDRLISEGSVHWTLDQMGKVERSVLRLATGEMLLRRQDPVPVVIDEAVRLAKELGGDEAGRFVNGVLGRLARGAGVGGAG
ncbi:MAG: transcription antitermination factor NusB [Candidatus Dormiibacterota bacterium]